MAVFTKKKREQIMAEERARLAPIEQRFLNQSDLLVVRSLLDDMAFCFVQMEEAKHTIYAHGITETYQNGANQKGQKKSSAVETYDKCVNNRLKLIKQIVDLLPPPALNPQSGEKTPEAELMEFINA